MQANLLALDILMCAPSIIYSWILMSEEELLSQSVTQKLKSAVQKDILSVLISTWHCKHDLISVLSCSYNGWDKLAAVSFLLVYFFVESIVIIPDRYELRTSI